MTNPQTMPFRDLPLGTRFKFAPTGDKVWVKLYNDGLIAEWTGYVGVFPGQTVVSITDTYEDETYEERGALEVTVWENA